MKRVSIPLLISVLTIGFSIFHLSNQSFSIIRAGEFNDPNLWLCHVYKSGEGIKSEISNGKLLLEVNDTLGEWLYSRVQQGILPHKWLAFDPLEREVDFRKNFEATSNVAFITILVNRSDLTFYNESGSQINAMILMWFDIGKGYDGNITQATVLDLEIRFLTAYYVNGSVSHHEREFARIGDPVSEGDPRANNDYHVFCSAPKMLESNETLLIEIDLGEYIEKAFSLVKRDIGVSLQSAKLKDFDVVLEANYGHGAITVEYLKAEFSPKIDSKYIIGQSGLNGIMAFVLALFLCLLFKRS